MDPVTKLKAVLTRTAFRMARLLAYGPETLTGRDPEKLRQELQEILRLLERESGLFADKTSTDRVRSVDMPWG